ncbi:hypothetical protein PWT90_07138 [Aphanocladium album]|nr:hypothetical protein PWT90_07138 [Aphanocladium album]
MDLAPDHNGDGMGGATDLERHEQLRLAAQRQLSSLCQTTWPATQPSKLGPSIMLEREPMAYDEPQNAAMTIIHLAPVELECPQARVSAHAGRAPQGRHQDHPRGGFPPCMQDAFAGLVGYTNKNENNEQVVWQLIERHADALFAEAEAEAESKPSESKCSLSMDKALFDAHEYKITEWLPKIQAAIIYMHVRLFDGDVRQRSLAERHVPILLLWRKQMAVETELFYPRLTFAEESSDRGSTSVRTGSGSPGHIGTRDWKLMRSGLWDAGMAIEWTTMMRTSDTLFVEPETAYLFYQVVSRSEVDSFGNAMIAVI